MMDDKTNTIDCEEFKALLRYLFGGALTPQSYKAVIAYIDKNRPTLTTLAQKLVKHQPCACIICTCEDEVRCQGCGAESCSKHSGGSYALDNLPLPLLDEPANT